MRSAEVSAAHTPALAWSRDPPPERYDSRTFRPTDSPNDSAPVTGSRS